MVTLNTHAHRGLHYREVQRVTQLWIWILVLVPTALAWWAFVQQVLLSRPFGTNPAPDVVVVIIWVAFGLALPLLILAANLRTEVRGDAVRLRFFPFRSRTVAIGDIQECEPRTYRPIGEYWGWGIRWTPGHGWCYTIRGNRGVQLTLAGGKRLLIGSNRPEELAEAINSRRPHGAN
jgi:hypothetical protein